jgi:hypothetical protein
MPRWRMRSALRSLPVLGLAAVALAAPAAASARDPWGIRTCVPSTDTTSPYTDNCYSGDVNFFDRYDGAMDQYLNLDVNSPAYLNFENWWVEHADRSEVFNGNHSNVYQNGMLYKDSYGIDPTSTEKTYALQNPADHSKPMYVNWHCGGGSCPQLAGDIANKDFRAARVQDLVNAYGTGYFRGLWLDDVPLGTATTDGVDDGYDGNGRQAVAYSPTLKANMTDADWRKYMHIFMDQIRAAFPRPTEILANVHWDPNTLGGGLAPSSSDPNSDALGVISDLDYVDLENEPADGNIHGGPLSATDTYTMANFRNFVTRIHNVGTAVVWDDFDQSPAPREYDLATFLLNNAGDDAVGVSDSLPSNWWAGWDINLGHAATPAQYVWNGLQRRDFDRGIVLANDPAPPGSSGTTVKATLPSAMVDTSGNLVTSVTLAPKQGAVLQYPGDAGGKLGATRSDFISVSDTSLQVAQTTNRGVAGPVTHAVSAAGSRATLVGDVDGDGADDLVKLDTNGTATTYAVNAGPTMSTTPMATTVTTLPAGADGTFLTDVSGDKRADLVSWNPTSVSIAFGAAGGKFPLSTTQTLPAGFTGNVSNQIADMNGDGRGDLVSWNSSGVVKVMLSGGATFAAPVTWYSGTGFVGTRANLACDVSRDGKADLVAIGDHVQSSVTNSAGTASGAPNTNTLTWTPGSAGAQYRCADMDGDGDGDIVSWTGSEILTSYSLYLPSTGVQYMQRSISPLVPLSGTKANLLGNFDRE